MTVKETVVILKWTDTTPPVQIEQDVTPYYRALESLIMPAGWRKTDSRLLLRIPYELQKHGEETYVIKGRQEVWIGDRDSEDDHWQGRPRFGGFINGEVLESKAGGDLVYDIPLTNYNIMPSTQDITGWPMDITQPIPYNATQSADPTAAAKALRGYPPQFDETTDDEPGGSYTLRDYLIGRADEGKPEDGIWVKYSHSIEIDDDGLDDFCTTILFGVKFDDTLGWIDTRPTNIDIPGMFAMTTLADATTEILRNGMILSMSGLLDYVGPIRPVWWLEPVVASGDATRIRPKLRVVDLKAAEEGSYDIYFSNDPADDSNPDAFDFEDLVVVRDSTNLQNVVPVAGGSSEDVTIDVDHEPIEHLRLVYAQRNSGLEAYPSPYHMILPEHDVAGWSGQPAVEERLDTAAQADTLAATLQANTLVEQVSLRFNTLVPVVEGMVILLHDEVREVTYQRMALEVTQGIDAGRIVYGVVAGWDKQTNADLASGDALDILLLHNPSPYLKDYTPYTAGQSLPGMAGYKGVRASAAAWQGEHDDKTVGHFYPSINRNYRNFFGLPVYKYAVRPSVQTTTPLPLPVDLLPDYTVEGAATLAAAPLPTMTAWGPDGSIKGYADADNNVHMQDWFMDFYEDTCRRIEFLQPTMLTKVWTSLQWDTATHEETKVYPTDTSPFSGLTLTVLQIKRAGGLPASIDPVDVTPLTPIIGGVENYLRVCITGLPDGEAVRVYFTERDPDPKAFGGTPVVP
jgi:hypothetical protein